MITRIGRMAYIPTSFNPQGPSQAFQSIMVAIIFFYFRENCDNTDDVTPKEKSSIQNAQNMAYCTMGIDLIIVKPFKLHL